LSVLTYFLLAFVEIVSLTCLLDLWHTPTSVVRKLCWTPVVLVPVLGPLFTADSTSRLDIPMVRVRRDVAASRLGSLDLGVASDH
jgi:hypothetical protein